MASVVLLDVMGAPVPRGSRRVQVGSFSNGALRGIHWPRLEQRAGKSVYELTDLVAYAAVVAERFLLRRGVFRELRWVVEGDVDHVRVAGEDGAGFVGVIADGDD